MTHAAPRFPIPAFLRPLLTRRTWTAAVVLALLLAAPATHAQGTASRTIDVAVSGTTTGQELPVREGDILRFTLSGAGGTGYSWQALDVDPAYLVLIDRQTVPAAAASGPVPVVGGAGPTTVYRYFVRTSLRRGGVALSVPVVFVHLPPGRAGRVEVTLIRYALVPR
ncbi:protease inhibitor I42 family protein [Deinococcus aerophilus]|uniref:Proteinase inhibitor I42 chagasin domain-containing protein n=1 Tax=Deinococcus aerophilus TaxID=522488 RepID=A0ABQ2GZW1_9DEIO|nr:protease inhibitor I42 family protein [Deinococcus aerophilus]GGM19942.1 hypothetical protein GCM10010841_29980 [Deinococcus aerophilus]